MVACSAPGKVILFGEHAVVFGEPALAIAINLRTTVRAEPATDWAVNGRPIDSERHRYVRAAMDAVGLPSPFHLTVESEIPEGSGMGSSAAISVSTLAALHSARGDVRPESIALEAFGVEHAVQGRASPIDTSTSTHGEAVLVLRERGTGFLWRVDKDDVSWFLHHRDMPAIDLVVGYTGLDAPTGPLVDKVRAFAERSEAAREAIKEIGRITLSGVDAIKGEDWEAVGKLMNRNHELLNALGVGHHLIDRLIEAVRPLSLGAKITGAGGGGSVIALTEDPASAARAIERAGGKPYKIKSGGPGLEVSKP